jgi:hypothetical protein
MKFVLFGGLVFIGGAIMYSAGGISQTGYYDELQLLGTISMILGAILGIFGLVKKNKE